MRSSTESQTAASRVNGAKSHGPVSPEGKAKCSRNAVRHGLSSRRILVDGESEDDLNALRVHWMRQLQPLTPAERETAEEVVAAQWRIRRCQETESALFSVEIKKLGVDASDSEALAAAFKTLADTSKALELLHRYMTAARRDFDRALKRFHEVVAARKDQFREDKYQRSEEGFNVKWGLNPDHHPRHYCGKNFDVLPNEPEPAAIFDAVLHPECPDAA